MKTLLLSSLLALLLTGCSTNDSVGSTTPTPVNTATVAYHSATIVYDTDIWKSVEDMDSLELKIEEYCWIDLTEDYTKHDPDWEYDISSDGALTVYSFSDILDKVSFPLGAEIVEGNVSVDDTEACMEAYRDLATLNAQ